jgi:hypothetical protein
MGDERLAADIIRDAMEGSDDALASWAAVYALRLGIKHDEEASTKALTNGVGSGDPLLQALCWRWLASLSVEPFPKWSRAGSDDPVVRVMAAMAFAGRGSVPLDLESALGEPEGEPREEDSRAQAKDRVERLLALIAPFDNGPLALAVAFVEARRAEWGEKGEGKKPVWVCNRLRSELAGLVFGDRPDAESRIERSKPVSQRGFTSLSQRLETALVKHPRRMLYSIAIAGEPGLQKDALRAIAVVASRPVLGDFGAAAAALRAKDPGVRLEGARTLLLLGLRARSS